MIHRKLLLAIISIILLGLCMFLAYQSGIQSGKVIGIAGIYIILRYIALVGGIILLLAWLFLRRNLSSSFVYIFFTVLDMGVCLSAVILFFLHSANRAWLHDCLLNGLVGVGMIVCMQLGKR